MGTFALFIQELQLMVSSCCVASKATLTITLWPRPKQRSGRQEAEEVEWKARIRDLFLGSEEEAANILSPHIPLARSSSHGPIQLRGRLGNSVPNWTATF